MLFFLIKNKNFSNSFKNNSIYFFHIKICCLNVFFEHHNHRIHSRARPATPTTNIIIIKQYTHTDMILFFIFFFRIFFKHHTILSNVIFHIFAWRKTVKNVLFFNNNKKDIKYSYINTYTQTAIGREMYISHRLHTFLHTNNIRHHYHLGITNSGHIYFFRSQDAYIHLNKFSNLKHTILS